MKRNPKLITVILVILLVATLQTTVSADNPSTWATQYVREAIRANLVPPGLQSNFTQPITRAEFASLMVVLYEMARGYEITTLMTFNDTDDINVQKMGGLGIITGVGGGYFNPDGNITREQAAVMSVRLGRMLGTDFGAAYPAFYDNDLMSHWAIEAVGQAQAFELMGGTGGNMFSPRGTYTREQSIVTALRLFNILEIRLELTRQYITTERLAEMIETGEIPAHITHLNLTGNAITDISPLASLTNLIELNLWANPISDISPLSSLTNLRVLTLANRDVYDISPLSYLTNLMELFISDVQYDSISHLGGLTNLQELYLWQSFQFDGDLSPLSNLTNLTTLTMYASPTTDFSPIENLTNLEFLRLLHPYQLRDFSIVNNLTNLVTLSIINAPYIVDYAAIGDLPNLRNLYLHNTRLECTTRLPLENLTHLRELSLSFMGITDMSPLRVLNQLTWLDLGQNQITDISTLSQMTILEIIYLCSNQITDISPLFGLPNLWVISLIHNPLDESQINALHDAFPYGIHLEF